MSPEGGEDSEGAAAADSAVAAAAFCCNFIRLEAVRHCFWGFLCYFVIVACGYEV